MTAASTGGIRPPLTSPSHPDLRPADPPPPNPDPTNPRAADPPPPKPRHSDPRADDSPPLRLDPISPRAGDPPAPNPDPINPRAADPPPPTPDHAIPRLANPPPPKPDPTNPHPGDPPPPIPGERPLRIVVVDDDNLMRAGLCAVLSSDDSIQIVGEAADGAAAIERATLLAPDVMLMDIRMPVLDGIEATRRIAAAAPGVRILVLTTFEDDDYVLGALRSGAAGFVLKRIRPEQLIEAIHTVAAGDKLLAPEVTGTVVEQLTRRAEADPRAVRRLARLTPRERDVLALIGRGLSNNEIAADLVVEESTVKTHIKRILAKLELRDRIHAVIFTYETGLVRPGDRPRPPPGR